MEIKLADNSTDLNKKYRRDIDGLRAIAVLAVVLDHLYFSGFKGGFIGVDIFFVISGYLITLQLISEYELNADLHRGRGWVSLRLFYFRRFRRIIPMAIFVLVVTLLISFVIENWSETKNLAIDSVWALLFVANFRSISEAVDYFQQNASTSPIQHFWTLAVEEQFYLIYPFIFLVTAKLHGLVVFNRRVSWRARVQIVLSVFILISFLWSVYSTNRNPTVSYFSSATRGWEIGMGCLSALIVSGLTWRISKKVYISMAAIGIASLALSFLVFSPSTPFPGYAALLPVIGTCLLLMSNYEGQVIYLDRILGFKPLRVIGLISYSIYLVHFPIIVFFRRYNSEFLQSNLHKLFLLALIIIVSTLTYKLIESPFRKLTSPKKFAVGTMNLTSRVSNRILSVNIENYVIAAAGVTILAIFFSAGTQNLESKSKVTYIPYEYSRSLDNEVLETSPDSIDQGPAVISEPSNILVNEDWKLRISKGLSETSYNPSISPKLARLEKEPWGIGTIYKNCVFSDTSPTNKRQSYTCSYSEPGNDATDILMVGDSHMEMFVPTILSAFQKSGINLSVMGRSGCSIGGLSLKNLDKVDDLNCQKIWSRGLAEKFAGRKFDFVIASDVGSLNNFQSKVDGMKGLKLFSPKVVLLGPTPIYDRLLDCISNELSLANCKISKLKLSSDAYYKNISNSAGVNFFPVSQFLCANDQRCPILIGEKSVTRGDGSHFSSEFAVELADFFRNYLITLR